MLRIQQSEQTSVRFIVIVSSVYLKKVFYLGYVMVENALNCKHLSFKLHCCTMFQNRKALDLAKEDFESQDTALRQDLPRLYEGRLDYFRPSFDSLLRSQLAYNAEAFKTYAEVSSELFRNLKLSEEERKERISQTLNEIKALSITVDD